MRKELEDRKCFCCLAKILPKNLKLQRNTIFKWSVWIIFFKKRLDWFRDDCNILTRKKCYREFDIIVRF